MKQSEAREMLQKYLYKPDYDMNEDELQALEVLLSRPVPDDDDENVGSSAHQYIESIRERESMPVMPVRNDTFNKQAVATMGADDAIMQAAWLVAMAYLTGETPLEDARKKFDDHLIAILTQ